MFFFSLHTSATGATKTFPTGAARPGKPHGAPCGWYESSFDLQEGLEVCEYEDDSLFQLWELSSGLPAR